MINRCIGCYYYDAKENICTHGSPIFIDDVCTDYQDSEFVMKIKADAIDDCIAKLDTLEQISFGIVDVNLLRIMFEELKEQNVQNSIIESLKPRGCADMPKEIVCNCTKEQK